MIREFNPIFLKINIIDMDDILRNPHLMSTCRALSKGDNHGMHICLEGYTKLLKERSVDACGIFAHYLDIPIGWLMFSYERDYVMFQSSENEAVCQLYVHHDWRRLGIGTRLIHLASRMANPDTLRVYEHNEYDFFRPLIRKIENLAPV